MQEKEKPHAGDAAQGEGKTVSNLLKSSVALWDEIVKARAEIEMAKEDLRADYYALYGIYTRLIGSPLETEMAAQITRLGDDLAKIEALGEEWVLRWTV